MNIALTGSSGLIGSKLLLDLQNMGHEVLCISSSTSSQEDNIFLYEEMRSKKFNFNADFILHLASINSNLTELEIDQEIDLLKKVTGIMETLNCKNIVFFSTIKVYGENSFDFNLIDEAFNQNPECFYGKAKAKCEKLLEKLSHEMKFNYLIFRMPPVLINDPKSNVGKLFQLVEKGVPIPSFAVGDINQRSFLSYDLLVYILKVILKRGIIASSQTFNLSDHEPISTNGLLKRFGKSINKKTRIIYLPSLLFKTMMKINRLQLILSKLFGNFHLSNAKLKREFKLPEHL
jgi:nucleoside-diphosphate-sugar epimerase